MAPRLTKELAAKLRLSHLSEEAFDQSQRLDLGPTFIALTTEI